MEIIFADKSVIDRRLQMLIEAGYYDTIVEVCIAAVNLLFKTKMIEAATKMNNEQPIEDEL